MFHRLLVLVFLCYLAKGDAACVAGSVKQTGVSGGQTFIIVTKHNTLRLQVAQGKVPGQPKASNMLKMVWDNTLAAAAQNVTDTCVFAHVRITDSRWFAVGQNLYASYSSVYSPSVDWNSAIQAWFDEHKLYNYSTVYQSPAGHYTQVVNAESYAVGCGLTSYYDATTKMYSKLYACNYGPAGNIIGVAPYKTGAGCENLC